MRIFCVGFYDLTSTIITTRGHISPWSETPQSLEKSNLLRRAKSSPSHKSAACIIGIVVPRNFGAATGPHNNSTQIDRRRIASKGLLCLITNRPSADYDTNRNYEEEIGFSCLFADTGRIVASYRSMWQTQRSR